MKPPLAKFARLLKRLFENHDCCFPHIHELIHRIGLSGRLDCDGKLGNSYQAASAGLTGSLAPSTVEFSTSSA